MNRYYNEQPNAPADIDRRTLKQVSRGINYGEYVFAYGRRHGLAWFGFGFSLALALMFIDSRISRYAYDTAEWAIMPLVFGTLFGAPVFSFALIKRRDQYDRWADSTIEVGNERATAVQPIKESVRPFVTTNNEPTAKTIAVGKNNFPTDKMQEWADIVLAREDLAIVRDDIPSGIYDVVRNGVKPPAITTQWRRRDIQNDLINLGWAEWTNAATGSIKLTEDGVRAFDAF